MSSAANHFRCHACGGNVLALDAPALGSLVGSDCTPVRGPGRVGACESCGLAQKDTGDEWIRMCAEIYGDYRIYHQAAGHEQKVRDRREGQLRPRSELIANFLDQSADVPPDGTALDIGCGNGAFLRAMHKVFPAWGLTGAELSDAFRSDILSISPRAAFLDRDELARSGEIYDIVSLIHCLEHISGPIDYLADARRRLKPTGLLLVQVPDAELNPFDLVVADHASHFSKATLAAIVEAAGYEVVACGNLIVGKEITLLARPVHGKTPEAPRHPREMSFARRNLDWLNATLVYAQRLAAEAGASFGIFGTSIAGLWIGSALAGCISFYVDEDEMRVGRSYFGVRIIAPDEIPAGGTVFVCLEPGLAARIAARHQQLARTFVLPPPLDGAA